MGVFHGKQGVGKKGRSGRKTVKEEVLKIATERMIKEIAKNKVYKKLETLKDKEVKDIALPIVLKEMSQGQPSGDLKQININVIFEPKQKKQIDNTLKFILEEDVYVKE